MKKMARFLIQKYSHMSGDKKVRIALDLSQLVRDIRKAGAISMGDNKWKTIRDNSSKQ